MIKKTFIAFLFFLTSSKNHIPTKGTAIQKHANRKDAPIIARQAPTIHPNFDFLFMHEYNTNINPAYEAISAHIV